MITFRQFIEGGAEAAPAMGTAPGAPSSPDSKKSADDPDPGTQYDTSVMDREFGISKEDSKKVLQDGEMIMSNRPLTNIPGQVCIASPPIPVMVKKVYPDKSADVTVMFSMANKEKLKHMDGQTEYQGPVKDLDTHMSHAELSQLRIGALKSGAGAGGGAPPGGPGGAPPGGAMAPPGAPPAPGGAAPPPV